MTVSASFFGTDGIRGVVELWDVEEDEAIRLIEDERTLTPAFMRLVGEALSYTQPHLPGEGSVVVVVGTGVRKPNLGSSLTLGLRLTGSRVIHIGECATPTLHRAVLVFGARAGCMITASHNPVSDSGIKVFDTFGYKSNRDYEADVSQTVRQLAEEDRDVDVVDREALSKPDEDRPQWSETAHRTWLAERWGQFESMFGSWTDAAPDRFASPFLIDCANGFGATWLAAFLREHGVDCHEVSSPSAVLNEGCGAGDLSPTATWTHEEAKASAPDDSGLAQRLKVNWSPLPLTGTATDAFSFKPPKPALPWWTATPWQQCCSRQPPTSLALRPASNPTWPCLVMLNP